MVPDCEINLVIHLCRSLYSDLCMHSPICIHQSGQVTSPPSAIALNSVTLYWSKQSARSHLEGAWLDWVVVTFIGVPGWASHQSDVGDTIINLGKEIHHPVPLSQGSTESGVVVMQKTVEWQTTPGRITAGREIVQKDHCGHYRHEAVVWTQMQSSDRATREVSGCYDWIPC